MPKILPAWNGATRLTRFFICRVWAISRADDCVSTPPLAVDLMIFPPVVFGIEAIHSLTLEGIIRGPALAKLRPDGVSEHKILRAKSLAFLCYQSSLVP